MVRMRKVEEAEVRGVLTIVKKSTDIWKSLNKQKFRLRESSAILGVIQNSLKKCNYLIDFHYTGSQRTG